VFFWTLPILLIVEQDGRDTALTGFRLLLGEHGVEAAYGVALYTAHRPAAVEYKD